MLTRPTYPTEAQAYHKHFYYNGHKVYVLTTHKPTCTVRYEGSGLINIVRLDRLESKL